MRLLTIQSVVSTDLIAKKGDAILVCDTDSDYPTSLEVDTDPLETGHSVTILRLSQVRRLRDTLTAWLETVD